MNPILDFISGAIKPVAGLIDNLHTSDEERLQVQQALTQLENQVTTRVLEYQAQLLASQSKIITAEAQGQSWLQRNWRPITMLTFLVLVVCDSFGLLAFRLAGEAWTLLQFGLGGYVVGRSAEKIAPVVAGALKGKTAA